MTLHHFVPLRFMHTIAVYFKISLLENRYYKAQKVRLLIPVIVYIDTKKIGIYLIFYIYPDTSPSQSYFSIQLRSVSYHKIVVIPL